jgi:hypothetical protein
MVEVGNYPTEVVTFKCKMCPHKVKTTDSMARRNGKPQHCGYYMEVAR